MFLTLHIFALFYIAIIIFFTPVQTFTVFACVIINGLWAACQSEILSAVHLKVKCVIKASVKYGQGLCCYAFSGQYAAVNDIGCCILLVCFDSKHVQCAVLWNDNSSNDLIILQLALFAGVCFRF